MSRAHQYDPEPQEREPEFVRTKRGLTSRRSLREHPEKLPRDEQGWRELLRDADPSEWEPGLRRAVRKRRESDGKLNRIEGNRHYAGDAELRVMMGRDRIEYALVYGEPEEVEAMLLRLERLIEEAREDRAERMGKWEGVEVE